MLTRSQALVLLLVTACDGGWEEKPELPTSALSEPRQAVTPPPPAGEVAQARRVLKAWLGRSFERPKRLRKQVCDDAELARLALDAEQRRLVLVAQDSRYGAKSLLPLRITRHLSRPRLSDLEASLCEVGEERVSTAAIERVRALEQSRFVGVYHVVRYSAPRRIRRPDRRRPEWVPGWLDVVLAVHDRSGGKPLCQARLLIQNDVTDAPLRIRLRSETRDRLTAELGMMLEQRTPAALASVTRVLELPEASPAQSALAKR